MACNEQFSVFEHLTCLPSVIVGLIVTDDEVVCISVVHLLWYISRSLSVGCFWMGMGIFFFFFYLPDGSSYVELLAVLMRFSSLFTCERNVAACYVAFIG